MHKYRLVREALERDPSMTGVSFRRSPKATREEVTRVHTEEYFDRFCSGRLTADETRAVGFPWSSAGVARSLASTGGTVAATRALLRLPGMRVAGHVAGGTHHAFRSHGSGFCVFSDIAVATAVALHEFRGSVKRVLICDLDVHQGDGNASIFQADDRVTTFSMHCSAQAFPLRLEVSDYDLPCPDGVEDGDYLRTLAMYMPGLLRRHKPDLVFYQGGVDGLAEDSLGRMNLTRAGLSKRNSIVYEACLSMNVPIVLTLGGGYARPDISPSVDAHADVYTDAMRALRASVPSPDLLKS